MPVVASPWSFRPRFMSLQQAIEAAGLTANLKHCFDFGWQAGYDPAQSDPQKILDLSGNANDFYLGADGSATTNDPTFNGATGGLSSSEYFSFDGGDFFREVSTAAYRQTLHKNNAIFTGLAAIYIPPTAGGTLWGNDGSAVPADQTGVRHAINTSAKQVFVCENSQFTCLQMTADAAMATGQWHMLAVTIDEATGAGGGFLWRDGAYDQVGSADTFNATYTSPKASDSPNNFDIGGNSIIADALLSGSRMAFTALWQGGTVDAAGLGELFALLRGRFPGL